MITYELAKELKDAGFPKIQDEWEEIDEELIEGNWDFYGLCPTLSELIEACDKLVEDCVHLCGHKESWTASDDRDGFGVYSGEGKTGEEAVARLWLALKKK